MAPAAVRSKAVIMLLLIHCISLLQFVLGFCVWSLFCYVVISVSSSLAMILLRKQELCCFALIVVWSVACDCDILTCILLVCVLQRKEYHWLLMNCSALIDIYRNLKQVNIAQQIY